MFDPTQLAEFLFYARIPGERLTMMPASDAPSTINAAYFSARLVGSSAHQKSRIDCWL